MTPEQRLETVESQIARVVDILEMLSVRMRDGLLDHENRIQAIDARLDRIAVKQEEGEAKLNALIDLMDRHLRENHRHNGGN